MIRDKLKKIKTGMRSTRHAVADIAQSVGAPQSFTEALRPDDPWANPRQMQSADDPPSSQPTTPQTQARESAPAPKAQPAPQAQEVPTPAVKEPVGTEVSEKHRAVQTILDETINPAVAAHGGYIGLVEVKDDNVYVQMSGGCQGCGAATMTLKAGVERMLREELPWVNQVLDTTDHSQGDNPFYT